MMAQRNVTPNDYHYNPKTNAYHCLINFIGELQSTLPFVREYFPDEVARSNVLLVTFARDFRDVRNVRIGQQTGSQVRHPVPVSFYFSPMESGLTSTFPNAEETQCIKDFLNQASCLCRPAKKGGICVSIPFDLDMELLMAILQEQINRTFEDDPNPEEEDIEDEENVDDIQVISIDQYLAKEEGVIMHSRPNVSDARFFSNPDDAIRATWFNDRPLAHY